MLIPRQKEVLHLLADGASTSQIQEMLQLSRETVRNHIRHLLRASAPTRASKRSRSPAAAVSSIDYSSTPSGSSRSNGTSRTPRSKLTAQVGCSLR